MTQADLTSLKEDHYTPREITDDVRELMGSIDLDAASDPLPNSYIQANFIFTKDLNALAHSWNVSSLLLNAHPQFKFDIEFERRVERQGLNVFLNPPGRPLKKNMPEYQWMRENGISSQSTTVAWWRKLLYEYNVGNVYQAVYLAFSQRQLANSPEMYNFPICFTTNDATAASVNSVGRIMFWEWSDEEQMYVEQEQPTQVNVFIYLPPKDNWFDATARFRRIFAKYGRCGVLV